MPIDLPSMSERVVQKCEQGSNIAKILSISLALFFVAVLSALSANGTSAETPIEAIPYHGRDVAGSRSYEGLRLDSSRRGHFSGGRRRLLLRLARSERRGEDNRNFNDRRSPQAGLGRGRGWGVPMAISAPRAKACIGYVPQELALYEEISANDNLRFVGSLYGLSGEDLAIRSAEALDLTGLTERAREPVSQFSGGMKRRLNIAMALLHRPKLLILDEPTVGVDPQSRNAIFESLRTLQNEGMTLLYTTHYMEEVEKLCQRVAVMDRGRIVAEDTVVGLQASVPTGQKVTVFLSEPLIANGPCPYAITIEDTTIHVELEDLGRDLPGLLNWLAERGAKYRSIQTERASLETVFLNLTGSSLRD